MSGPKLGVDNCEKCGVVLEDFDQRVQGLCPQCSQKEMNEAFATMRTIQREFSEAGKRAKSACYRLAKVLMGTSGQPYKLRALLFSLWNGKPWTLNDVVALDWTIRKDLCLLLLGWGSSECFYDELREAIESVGQWEWFIEEAENLALLNKYVQAGKKGAKP